jgi:hypothetical protein
MKVVVAENMWWPFGAHLYHVRWGRTFAEKRGWGFFYERNDALVFPTERVSDWFDDTSTVLKSALDGAEIVPWTNAATEQLMSNEEKRTWRPWSYSTARAYHTDLMRQIYRPAQHVRTFLLEDSFLSKLEGVPYVAAHIRRGDKIDGPSKEMDVMPLSWYVDACRQLCERLNTRKVVLCSDVVDTFGRFVDLASRHELEVCQASHSRPRDEWQQADVVAAERYPRGHPRLLEMYRNCFLDMEILRRARAMVGDLNSGFASVAWQLRGCADDVNVRNVEPLYL